MMMWQALLDGFSVLSDKWTLVISAVSIACMGCSVSILLSQDLFKEKAIFRRSGLLVGFFFALSVILRLAFLTGTFVPPYFDSVEHYRIIKGLVTALEASTLFKTIPTLTTNYYHLGFHILASLLTFGLHANPIDMILVLGQVILAAIPIPVFFLTWQITRSEAAAFFSMFLAGFGWYMPGFAVNWGKYPALTGLLSLEIVLSIAYFIDRNKPFRNQALFVVFLVLGIAISTFFHSRTLVIIAVSIGSWLIAGKLPSIPGIYQYVILSILFAGILVFGKVIQAQPLLNLTLGPYLGAGIWVTLVVAALSPFALIKSPQGFYFSILFILCVFATLFIPLVLQSPSLENQTLLDRPFAEMVLYLPLSFLGGLGLAGLLQSFKSIRFLPEKIYFPARVLTTILLLGFTGLMSIKHYDFYSSDCCKFVQYDDTVAMNWLDRNVPPDALILSAAAPLSVLPAGPSTALAGTDAGIWIPALAGRNTLLAPFDIDFRSAITLEQLCQEQVDYVYVGGTAQKFNAKQLNDKAEWYEGVLFLPNVQLYRLIGCSGPP